MTIHDYEIEMERKFPMGPDVIEECKAVTEMAAVSDSDWSPLFEPHDFNEEHGPLDIESYRL